MIWLNVDVFSFRDEWGISLDTKFARDWNKAILALLKFSHDSNEVDYINVILWRYNCSRLSLIMQRKWVKNKPLMVSVEKS